MKFRIEPDVRPVVTSALALSGAVGVFALAFGVLAVGAGASVWQTCALSFFAFTGASQMSAMSIVSTGGTVSAALGSGLLLAARNGVYGLALSPYFGESLGKRLLAAHFVIDETTAMMTAQTNPRLQKIAFWTTAIALFSLWNLGTLIGAVLGGSIDPHTYGLDVGHAGQEWVDHMLGLPAMLAWEKDALIERWREAGHEAELRACGEIIADYRRA